MEYETFHSVILEAAEKGDLTKFKLVVEETKENLKKIRKCNSALALDAAANFHGGLVRIFTRCLGIIHANGANGPGPIPPGTVQNASQTVFLLSG